MLTCQCSLVLINSVFKMNFWHQQHLRDTLVDFKPKIIKRLQTARLLMRKRSCCLGKKKTSDQSEGVMRSFASH